MKSTFVWLFILLMFGTPEKLNAKKWEANLTFYKFNTEERNKILEAIRQIKEIIRTHKFKNRVTQFKYKGEYQFNQNEGLSNKEIYQKILDGAEEFGKNQIDHSMDIELELFEGHSKIVGYTYPNTKRIWINRNHLSRFKTHQVANNLMHEWMHKLGFNHDIKWSTDRDFSVPYAIGYIFEDLISEKLNPNLKRN